MKILHTADWHLGASLDSVSLLEDQRRFLDWLLEVIREEGIDALLVSGDVFDLRNPSAEAQSLYYRFLARLAALDPAPVAVITAGNHDSPSRLGAPSELLDALRIRVVGGVGPRETWARRLLVPLPDPEAPRVVVAAVPYVHEYALGVSPVGLAPGELGRAMHDAFADLYGTLAEEAARRWPGARRMAMGHLTVGGGPVDRDDFPNEIHQVGTIDALPPSLFGEGWDYVALGHIHRPMAAGDPHCRYSGTPVAISFGEGSPARQVRLLEISGDGPDDGIRHRARPVPRHRSLVKLRGMEEEVLAGLGEAEFFGELEPLLRVEVTVSRWDPTLELRIREAVAALGAGGPRLLAVVQRTAGGGEDPEAHGEPVQALEDLRPDEVFRRLVRARRGGEAPDDDDALMVAFREILSAPETTDAEGGP
ncbi:MAG: exonuclease subunit SbcD [Gemmatimonadales bacterium]|nr:MAG: exonuclease subunit SbcD [Gemmatimonadales bacterium]